MKAVMLWAVSIFLFANFAWVAFINLRTAIRWYLHRKRGSSIPLIGGLLGCVAMIAVPLNGFDNYWWVPLLVDIGCVPLVLGGIVYLFAGIVHKRRT